jgi:hypothetical protein
MVVAEHPAADAEDKRAITAHERFDGRLVTLGQKPFQELVIGHVRSRITSDQMTDIVKQRVWMGICHAGILRASITDPTLLETAEAEDN